MITNFHLPLTMLAAILALGTGHATANYADSSNVTVDTWTLTMTTLVISGPSSVPWGQATITRDNGKIFSNLLSVTVTEGNGMNIGISWPAWAG